MQSDLLKVSNDFSVNAVPLLQDRNVAFVNHAIYSIEVVCIYSLLYAIAQRYTFVGTISATSDPN